MDSKTILITGATDGIGKQTAKKLAQMGHTIIVHGRNEVKVNKTIEEIQNETGNDKIHACVGDFTSLKQVRNLVEELKKRFDCLDVLINNAGDYMQKYVLTEDGYETTFQVNHLSHFLLTNLVMDLIKNSSEGRIINVSSIAHQSADFDLKNLNSEKYFSPYNAYAVSKFANILFTKMLAKKLSNTNITVNSLHPGVINTKLLRAGFNIIGDVVERGAETPLYLATSEEVKNITGEYFIDKKVTRSHSQTYNENLWSKFWDISKQMVNLDSSI
ncbi:MAG: SDR family oxidoreductase [Melioribacter sp.]|nr:SDR family oxidoreductase [Melioribacter sp.]